MTTSQKRPSITPTEMPSPHRHQREVATLSQSLSGAFDWSRGLLSVTASPSDEIRPPRNNTGSGFDSFYDSLGEEGVDAIVDKDNFRHLQNALRNRGCVTNMYLQQHVSKYVDHVMTKRQRQQLLEAEATRLGRPSPGIHRYASV